jgi:membrane-associated protease RseP (regulator of RpoE activity)
VFSPDSIGRVADNVSNAGDEPSSSSGDGASENDGRLISILGVIQIGSQLDGWHWVLALFIQVNIFIGLFNMLPLLPLDGGHAAVAIYERIRSRPGRQYHADFAKLLPLTYAVVLVLVVVGVTALYLDAVDPIQL